MDVTRSIIYDLGSIWAKIPIGSYGNYSKGLKGIRTS